MTESGIKTTTQIKIIISKYIYIYTHTKAYTLKWCEGHWEKRKRKMREGGRSRGQLGVESKEKKKEQMFVDLQQVNWQIKYGLFHMKFQESIPFSLGNIVVESNFEVNNWIFGRIVYPQNFYLIYFRKKQIIDHLIVRQICLYLRFLHVTWYMIIV